MYRVRLKEHTPTTDSTAQLAISGQKLEKCRDMGLNRILITCDSDNLASKKIIERNGGEFESAMNMDDQVLKAEGRHYEKTIQKLRYWIDLKSTHR